MASIIVAQNYQFGERGGSGNEPLVMKTIQAGNAVTFALAHPQSNVELPDYSMNPDLTGTKTPVIMSFDADKKVTFYHNTIIDMKNVHTVHYKPESVITEAIKEYNVTEVKMANDAVVARVIKDGEVIQGKLGVDAVVESNILKDSVTTEKIKANAVTTVKLNGKSVTKEKMGDNSIETRAIIDKNVTTAKLAEKAVTTDRLGDGSVTSVKLAKDIEFKSVPTVAKSIIDDTALGSVNGTFDGNERILTNATWVKNYTLSGSSGLARKASDETVTGSWTFTKDINGIAVKAKWADLAESYQADAEYPVGTLVCFGGEKEITVATSHANAVVSEQPAVHMNAEMENGLPIALSGRVRVRVVGKVEKFDKIILSDLSGVGVADNCSCGTCVVGRALESKETEEEGLVLCVVALNLD